MQAIVTILALVVLGVTAQDGLPPRPTPAVLDGVKNCTTHLMQVQQAGLLGSWRPKCEADGTYSAKQTHGSTGMSFCVDKQGTTILPLSRSVRACECPRKRAEMLHTTSQIAVGKFLPRCEADGTFSPLQIHASTGFVKCFTPEGQEILSGREVRFCKCPLARFIAGQTGRMMVGQKVPQCNESTGGYLPRQSHGSTGYSWCVDQEGVQVGEAVSPANYNQLDC